MWLPYYFCSLSKYIYTGCLNIHGTHVTANNSTTTNIGGFNIHKTHVTANNSTSNNVVLL